MKTKKLLIVIVLIAVITVGILVPILILTNQPPVDKTPPTIQILSPINTEYTMQEIAIDITTSDTDVDSIWYRIHNDTAASWVDATNITWTTVIPRTLNDGGYTLYAWANDTTGNTASAVTVSFTINAIPPRLTILSPINKIYTKQPIDINFISGDSDIHSIWYRIYNETAGSWVDAANITWTTLIQRTFNEGGYTLYAWANDTAGNTAAAVTVSFTVDVVPPILLIVSPTNTTYLSQTTQITIDLSSPDLNCDTFWYRIYNETGSHWLDSMNITWTAPCQRTLGSGGIFTVYAWMNDSFGVVSPMESVTLTMYHEIIYSGNHVFSADFTVEKYQKVTFQNGDFSFTSGTLTVWGTFLMYNVTWTSNLYIYGNSECVGTNITFNGVLIIQGNLDASLANITTGSSIEMTGNSNVTITDAIFGGTLYTYNSAKLVVNHASGVTINSNEFAKVNVSYSTGVVLTIYGYSVIRLQNYTGVNCELSNNASLTLINTTISSIYENPRFISGDWIVNHNIASGSGTYEEPKLTAIDSNIAYHMMFLTILGTTKVLLNNSIYSAIYTRENSNVTLSNTTLNDMTMYDQSNATIINSNLSYLQLSTNGTIYLEEANIETIFQRLSFSGGNIYGYNDTFFGATSWSGPKITQGPDVIIEEYRYSYTIFNNVQFLLINTSHIVDLSAVNSANVTLISCNSGFAYLYAANDANITLYHSNIGFISAQGSDNTGNITIFNSTCNIIHLYGHSYATIIQYSHVNHLYYSDYSWYYKSADSTIDAYN